MYKKYKNHTKKLLDLWIYRQESVCYSFAISCNGANYLESLLRFLRLWYGRSEYLLIKHFCTCFHNVPKLHKREMQYRISAMQKGLPQGGPFCVSKAGNWDSITAQAVIVHFGNDNRRLSVPARVREEKLL